jgi:biotin transport system ATP-binding protein
MKTILAQDISLHFQDQIGLIDINVNFKGNELTIITGPNGSGKTLLLRSLAGLIKPDTGEIRFDGKLNARGRGRSMDHLGIGMVFQDPMVQILGLTVEEDIRFGLDNLNMSAQEREQRVRDALDWCGLLQRRDQECRSLSGGERRRLCIASIMALEPDFIMMDEPFSNLDYPGVKEVLALILKLKQAGKGMIIVTHDLDRSLAYADRLILMKNGRIIADALPERVLPFLEDHGVRRPSGKISDMTWLK